MNKHLFSFYMKKIYNEDAAITAATSLVDGANAATSGIGPELLGLTALKYLTDKAFKYTGDTTWGERDIDISKKDAKKLTTKDIKDIVKNKFNFNLRTIPLTLTNNPVIYLKYIILEYMITKLKFADSNDELKVNNQNDIFESTTKAEILFNVLLSNNLTFFIKKSNISPSKTYPKTIIITNAFKITDIEKIKTKLQTPTVEKAFAEEINKFKNDSSFDLGELNNVYNNTILENLFNLG